MHYDTILFDLDGTILDSLADLADSVNAVLAERGHPLRTSEEIKWFTGSGFLHLLTESLPHGTSMDEIQICTKLYQKYYLQNIAKKSGPYPGILPLLESLKQNNYKLGVVSNKFQAASEEACRLYFPNLFSVVVGDLPGRSKKPASEGVLYALSKLGSLPEDSIFVGDSEVDVQTAKNAGLYSIGVTWGFRPRNVLENAGVNQMINNPCDLINLLLQLNPNFR